MNTVWNKTQVINWFGARGKLIKPSHLKKWHWEDRKLFFVIDSGGTNLSVGDTEKGKVDYTCTHREDGSPIIIFELYDELPIESTPLAKQCERA